MTKDKTILIQNVYYMLSYAFQELRKNNYEDIAKEEFEYVQDLFAEIIYKGISAQLKRGLHREYVERRENLSALKGRLDIRGSIINRINCRSLLKCDYDELLEDNKLNQVLKTTLSVLLQGSYVKKMRKNRLRKLMPFFSEVKVLDIRSINWNNIVYQRNNQSYRMLINLCYFILDGMLMTTETGTYRLATFSEEHMNRLFERFVLEYYRVHHKYLLANPDKIYWNVDDVSMIDFLPEMKTDIVLHRGEHTLIIDTKYYGTTLQTHFNKSTIHSSNMYQIFTYVKNFDMGNSGNVSGLLLYAKTDEDISPDFSAVFDKNMISVKTLDLNQQFSVIAKQLDSFIEL